MCGGCLPRAIAMPILENTVLMDSCQGVRTGVTDDCEAGSREFCRYTGIRDGRNSPEGARRPLLYLGRTDRTILSVTHIIMKHVVLVTDRANTFTAKFCAPDSNDDTRKWLKRSWLTTTTFSCCNPRSYISGRVPPRRSRHTPSEAAPSSR